MSSLKLVGKCATTYAILMVGIAIASTDTIGPNGINSAGLTDFNGMPLTGTGAAIGQAENRRPGDPNFDTMGNLFHSSVEPAEVFFRQLGFPLTFAAEKDEDVEIGAHAVQVAGIMISSDISDPDEDGDSPTGVAPSSALYSAGSNQLINVDEEAAITLQHLATLPGVDIRATNMSFGHPLAGGHILDGNQLLTQFVDWSASQHNVLYIVAGNEGTLAPIPTDNYNGITVAASEKDGDKYRRVWSGNTFNEDAVGPRTSVDLLAPGDNVKTTTLGDATAIVSGTSYAAPHVTGTVALLQQYAEERIMNAGGSRWNANARRHEVMKAVLMNSADKLIDNGTVMLPGETEPVPEGHLLGMERTVLKQPQPGGNPNPTWLDSPAYDNTAHEGFGRDIALDIEMGAGHLNASRAHQQFRSGEWNANAADVPLIGWDYGHTSGAGNIQKYVFAQPLLGGSFISITLAWDRVVEFAIDANMNGEYDLGDTFQPSMSEFPDPPGKDQFNAMDLWLLPKGSFNIGQAIAESSANYGAIQHMFFQIPTTGEYEFWVRQFDAEIPGGQDYAVAWWAMADAPPPISGDFNGDGRVDAADYVWWRKNDGSSGNYIEWRENFGTTSGGGSFAAVPEPSSAMLLMVAGVMMGMRWRAWR